MEFDTPTVALWFARARGLIGVSLAVVPGVLTRFAVGEPTPTSRAVMRMVGVRDVAIGIGAVTGVREGSQAPEWLGWGAVADGIDALVLLLTPGLPKRARLTGLFAAGAAVVGIKLAWELADARADREFEVPTSRTTE